MINTVGLLLESYENFEFATDMYERDVEENFKALLNQTAYNPRIKFIDVGKLKVEFCPAKLLYGNNLYEITADNLLEVLVKLTKWLEKIGLITCPALLLQAHVYRIDYAKVCYIPFSSHTLATYLQSMHGTGHYKQAFTFYADDGHMAVSSLKLRKIAFYNKTAEVLRDKRVSEDLKDVLHNLSGIFYRFECSLKTAKEIRRELETCRINIPACCLQELVKPDIITSVLQKNLNQTTAHWHVLDKPTALEKVAIWLDEYKHCNTRALLTDILCAMCCICVGVEDLRQIIITQLDKRHARDFMKRFERLGLENQHCLAVFKDIFTREIQTLTPITQTYITRLKSRSIVKENNTCLSAHVLLAIIELLINASF